MPRSRAAVLAALALSLSACAAAQLPNPIAAGGVAPNHETASSPAEEDRYGLPRGSLTSEAALVSMTGREVCFQVVLRTVAGRLDLASPAGWDVSLGGKPDLGDTSPRVDAVEPLREDMVSGVVRRVSDETYRICDGYGMNCVHRQVRRTRVVPTVVPILTGGGTICFPGELTAVTTELTLRLADPQTSWPLQRRLAFRYRFE